MKEGGNKLKDTVNQIYKMNDKAFLELMEKHQLYLYKAAYAYLGSREEALDALQETSYRAYKNRKSLRDNSNVKAWLLKILINYCRDRAKKRKRIIYFEDINKNVQSKFEKSYNDNIDDSLIIQDALSSMENPYKEVLILKYFDDLKIKNIAEIMKKPESTIKTWLYKGLSKIKKIISEEELKNAE